VELPVFVDHGDTASVGQDPDPVFIIAYDVDDGVVLQLRMIRCKIFFNCSAVKLIQAVTG
jgi:hypothetical protein